MRMRQRKKNLKKQGKWESRCVRRRIRESFRCVTNAMRNFSVSMQATSVLLINMVKLMPEMPQEK